MERVENVFVERRAGLEAVWEDIQDGSWWEFSQQDWEPMGYKNRASFASSLTQFANRRIGNNGFKVKQSATKDRVWYRLT